MLKDIISASPKATYKLELTFEDGVKGVVDVSRIISFRAIFAPLADPSYFARVRVDRNLGTVCWPNGADLDPDVLYGCLVPDADSLTAPMPR